MAHKTSKRFLLMWVCFAVSYSLAAQKKIDADPSQMRMLIEEQLQKASRQYRYFCTQVNDSLFPRTVKADGTLENSKSWWWCSGFFPGTLLYLCKNSMDDSLYREALRRLSLLEKEQYNKGTHDLGFMMYCSFGNALKMSYNKRYEKILLQSARSLASRFSPVTGCIRSWNPKKPDEFLVIIDNMMNLELLFYATRVTGDSSFYKIAVSHAGQTMKHHFRPDYSSYHVVEYSENTGAVTRKRTHQGYSDASAWARGQAWALYGYTMMYREAKDEQYLAQANKIAAFILHHPRLPKDKIPYWDFDAPDIPHALRDASSTSVIASALIELSQYNYNKAALQREYLEVAAQMIRSLSSPEYFTKYKEARGFLLKHSVGSLPHDSEVDVPLTYADYYYVEALMRYKDLVSEKTAFQ
ncbi:MAG: glycoside hydrolase family 88 protein [Niabella sp.]